MAGDLQLACRCATVQIALSVPGRSAGTRCVCYCGDCQTAARVFGPGDDLLGPAGGTDIWQTTPDRVDIRAGQDRLAILRLSPKGLYRWHATCCDTPLFNTLPRMGVPFVGVVLRPDQAAQVDPVLGPVFCYHATAGARPGEGAPSGDVHFARAVGSLIWRMAAAVLSGRGKRNPLRAPDGGPNAPIRILTRDQRDAARP